MKQAPGYHRPRRSRLVLGIFLLVLGALLLAVNLGYGLPVGWWEYLPVLLIAFGVWGLVLPNRHVDRVGGVWMVATGVYFLVGLFDLWHLGWSGAWPIFVIAAGLGFILHRHPEDSTDAGELHDHPHRERDRDIDSSSHDAGDGAS